VSKGPLGIRFGAIPALALEAGALVRIDVEVENTGSIRWPEGIHLAYHWLDSRDNPIVWDGLRTEAPPLRPRERTTLEVAVRSPIPPGPYRLAFDHTHEHRFWFAEAGSFVLEVPVDVAPRIVERRLAVVVHGGEDDATRVALDAQDEALVEAAPDAVAHLVAGAVPAHDWSRRVLDAHAEGWAAVGPRVEPGGNVLERRRGGRRLAAWSGPGRNPRLGAPLLLPSLLRGLEPAEHDGLPAWTSDDGLYEGRAVVTLRPRSGRPPG